MFLCKGSRSSYTINGLKYMSINIVDRKLRCYDASALRVF